MLSNVDIYALPYEVEFNHQLLALFTKSLFYSFTL